MHDQLTATVKLLETLDGEQYTHTIKNVGRTTKLLDELQANLEAVGDPKAEAIKILRAEGWMLTPPRS